MEQATGIARLETLRNLDLLDTDASETFDRITRTASQLFNLPIAAISLTDSQRQWFKSRVGLEHKSIPRDRAPCSAVAASKNVLVINDIRKDQCYANSNLAATGVRFYAGAPLITRDGHALGSLCVLGPEPREVQPAEIDALRDLAEIVMSQIELQHAFGRIDPLSGLPNRMQFVDDLSDLARDFPGTQRLAVLIDLARVDQISNGTSVLGSAYVDDVFSTAAKLMRRALGPTRKAYHVSAMQFAFLAPPDTDEEDYLRLLSATLKSIQQAATINFMMTAAIGATFFTLGEISASDIVRRAHSAALNRNGR